MWCRKTSWLRLAVFVLVSLAVTAGVVMGESNLPPVGLSWYFFQPDPGPGLADVEKAVNEYIKPKINATIKIFPLGWDEFHTKVSAMAAANEPFDIVFSPGWLSFEQYQAKNMYLDITEMLPKYCPKTMDLFKKNAANMKLFVGCTVGKRIFGLPTLKEVGHCPGIFLNKKMVDKYKINVNKIKTAKDIEPLLKLIKDKEPGMTPLLWGGGWGLDKWLGTYNILSDDVIPLMARSGSSKVEVNIDIPENVNVYKLLNKWYNKGYFPKDAPVMDVTTHKAYIDSGKVFMTTGNVLPGSAEAASNDKVTWITKRMTAPSLESKDLGGSQNSISRTSRNPERALMFLELVNTDKTLNNLLAFGLENKHYKKTGANTIKLIDGSGYNHGWQWAYGNQLLNYLRENEPANKWEQMEEFNDSCIPDPNLGYKFTEMEKWANVVAAAKTIANATYIAWGIGDIDAEVKNLRKKYEVVGFYRFRDAVQKDYDAWLAANKK